VKLEYRIDFLKYKRRQTIEVNIGGVPMGGSQPIRIQSMTNTDTCNTQDTVRQIIQIACEGADYVRLTVPGQKEAGNLSNIIAELTNNNCNVPLVADIHFNPKVAKIAAAIVDKVRINPGNYVDKKLFKTFDYTPEQYNDELSKLRDEFITLLEICRKHNTVLRIGVNHGSLSDRIMSRYGDTPEGMTESAMEFLRICRDENFKNVVVSLKASNTRIMVFSNRMLVSKIDDEGMNYPMHLGVTEAGEGEDGRIKSAVGIGALLADGIGETIRVSLTEDPHREIPFAHKLVSYLKEREHHTEIPAFDNYPLNPFDYQRRSTLPVGNIGGNNLPVVISESENDPSFLNLNEIGWHYSDEGVWLFDDMAPDYLIVNRWPKELPIPKGRGVILPADKIDQNLSQNEILPLFYFDTYKSGGNNFKGPKFIQIFASRLLSEEIEFIKKDKNAVLIIETNNKNGFADQRAAIIRLMNNQCYTPVILKREYSEILKEDFQLKSAADLGGLFIDGIGDGIWIENKGTISEKDQIVTSFGILQASRSRISKTEYISCPSCGRTLFDLQNTTRRIRECTLHLKGLKIGIMGCIVNGPGEMADADYGYIGTGKGLITLYKGKEVVKKNVPEKRAVDELINLIKEKGDWVEP
jgi:(E)-4-hydroxy-3-methylbut-2-enyl-diphosphate synthase